MVIRDFIVRLARQFIGTPYIWGGSRAYMGFDCSGFVIFLLRPFGILPEAGDWTAQNLSRMFEETVAPEPGDLAFFGANPESVTHVMVYLGAGQTIGAAGGGHACTTVAIAKGLDARVKTEPVAYRKDLIGYRNIFAARAGAKAAPAAA
jgi:cell wall-associated NlpC family hydrolase